MRRDLTFTRTSFSSGLGVGSSPIYKLSAGPLPSLIRIHRISLGCWVLGTAELCIECFRSRRLLASDNVPVDGRNRGMYRLLKQADRFKLGQDWRGIERMTFMAPPHYGTCSLDCFTRYTPPVAVTCVCVLVSWEKMSNITIAGPPRCEIML